MQVCCSAFYSVVLTFLMLFGQSVWVDISFADSALQKRISLSGANESWINQWTIEASALKSPEDLTAGFYRQLPSNLNLRIPGGRRGFVCIFPESRYKPARIVSRQLTITNENRLLVVKVAASSFPRGRWEFELIVNDRLFTSSTIINGNDGWQDMEFDLAAYMGQRIDLAIEGKMIGNGRDSSMFIDYLGFTGLDGHRTSNLTPDGDNQKKLTEPFDAEYLMFLEIWRRYEETRHSRMMDRNAMDSFYHQSAKIKKKQKNRKE